jgi:nitrogenase molybdenum-iron protein alpha/beta subunit
VIKPLQPPTRERRTNALSAYLGDIESLIAEFDAGVPNTRIRTFSQTAADDVAAALGVLVEIEGLGVVVHGARGCAGALAPRTDRPWVVTNLSQRDTILGADGALARTLRQLHRRHQPWAIVIVATPVVAINNDDIQAVAEELSDEFAIPVIELRTDGFRSRVAATGGDIAAQAVAALVPPGGERRANLINLLALGQGPGLTSLVAQLAAAGIEVNLLPAGANQVAFGRAAQAAASVAVFDDEADVLGIDLERLHAVPFLRLRPPIGTAATDRFVSELAAFAGLPHSTSSGIDHELASLAGRQVVVALPPSQSFAVADLVESFGGQLAGLGTEWIDTLHLDALKVIAARHPALPVHVAAGQPFELVNWLGRLKPDLVIGTPITAAIAARIGIASVAVQSDELLGAEGEARLATRIERALGNPALARRLAASAQAYHPAWLKRSPDWHIKREVR